MKIRVRVPATTANLGPGFDALGLALDLWNEAVFSSKEDGRVQVTIRGEGQGQLPVDQANLIAISARRVYQQAAAPFPGLLIESLNRIPLASGLGSSSAAVLTGLLGANGLLGGRFSREELLQLAIQIEGHPDNVAPAMLGGLTVSASRGEEVISRRIEVSQPLHVTIALPDVELSTESARQALPLQVSRQDAVYNLGRTALVVEALRSGDLDLLGAAMQDALHQPYRLPLIPGAAEALEAARESGAAGAGLSGAGPGLAAFSRERAPAIGAAMQAAFREAGLDSGIFELTASMSGAEVIIE